MSTQPSYPQPYEDADNAPFLAAWRKGMLVLPRGQHLISLRF